LFHFSVSLKKSLLASRKKEKSFTSGLKRVKVKGAILSILTFVMPVLLGGFLRHGLFCIF